MPVLKQRHTKDFTVIPNALLQDHRLSLRDVGLLIWMLSKPLDWKFTKKNILAEISNDGERSVQAAVKKLQETGYLTITRAGRKKGKLAESIWTVYDAPQLQNAVMEKQHQPKAKSGSPQLRYPAVQNAVVLLNKDITKDTATKNAVPALEGGVQLPNGFYFDEVSGAWCRKEST